MIHFDVFQKQLVLFENELILFPTCRFSYSDANKVSCKEGSLGPQGPKGSHEPKLRRATQLIGFSLQSRKEFYKIGLQPLKL